MNKRGPKPEGNVKLKWSGDFAYASGLLATDGCVYKDGRHIDLTSKDIEQVRNFKKALGLTNKITKKSRDRDKIKKYFHIQFGDVIFVEFLKSIGIMSAKSKRLGVIKIPREYFPDFIRGCFDGDGTFYSYWDKRWRSSFMYYVAFVSASKGFIDWIRSGLRTLIKVEGHMTSSKGTIWQLRYAKKEANKVIRSMYHSDNLLFLPRKRLKINKIFAMIGEQQV